MAEVVGLIASIVTVCQAKPGSCKEDGLNCALSRAQRIIEQLHRVIVEELIKQGDGSHRIRRRAWMMNKSKIVNLYEDLKDVREALLIALSTEIWSESNDSLYFKI